MTGAGVEVAALESQKKHDASRPEAEHLSSGSLDLLKENSSKNSSTDTGSNTLPSLAVVSPGHHFSGRDVSGNPNLAMGNPSDASTSDPDNYLVAKDQYVESYNSDHKTPNWVAWQLDSDWIGSTGRTGPFTEDTSLPPQLARSTSEDYTGSGYDRGHNCNSADRSDSRQDNEATFLMSNIAPQAPDNNRGPWEKLESYCRDLAKQGDELYIISGNEGSKGSIGNGVNVPQTWFKVIVALPQKGMGAADVNANTQVIAVEMPNENGIKHDDWRQFETTIGNIESHTGYHFLTNVPENVRRALESKTYNG